MRWALLLLLAVACDSSVCEQRCADWIDGCAIEDADDCDLLCPKADCAEKAACEASCYACLATHAICPLPGGDSVPVGAHCAELCDCGAQPECYDF